jgi:hypothetical protein
MAIYQKIFIKNVKDIETVLAKTKIAHSRRVFCEPENENKKINLKDLDKGFEIYIKTKMLKFEMDEYLYILKL